MRKSCQAKQGRAGLLFFGKKIKRDCHLPYDEVMFI